ncbi:hypothetical protein [Paroceanicella profunda]|uniref:hypothetical protein n=1 Tax=Paroceanicella profunda TaxID=2579971 RepID=UPI00321198D3
MHRKRKDSSEIAANVDLHLAVHRRQNDVLDQRPDDIGGFRALFFVLILQGVVEALDARAVKLRHRGMQQRWRVIGRRQERGELCLTGFQALHVVDDGLDRSAGLDGGQQF